MSAVTFAEKFLQQQTSDDSFLSVVQSSSPMTEDIVSALNISKRNPSALEENRFDDIPEGIYRDLSVKTYATYLGFSWDEMRSAYATQVSPLHCAQYRFVRVSSAHRGLRPKPLGCPPDFQEREYRRRNRRVCALSSPRIRHHAPARPWQSPLLPTMSRVAPGRVQVLGSTATDANVTINGKAVRGEPMGHSPRI